MTYTSIIGKLNPLFEGNAVSYVLASSYLQDPSIQSRNLYVDSHTGQGITVAQYRKLIPRAIALFKGSFKITKGDVVGIYGVNHIFTAAIHFGVVSLGGVISPANVMYTSEELAHQLKMTTPKLVLVFDPLVKVAEKAVELSGVQTRILTFSDLFGQFMQLMAAETAPEMQPIELDGKKTPAYYCFSSGTSGLPKGVVTTHYNILSNAIQMTSVDSDVYTQTKYSQAVVLPMSHIFALNIGIWLNTIQARFALVFPKFDLEDFVSKVCRYKTSFMCLVPPILLLLGKTEILDKYPEFGECVKYVDSGAAPLSSDLVSLVSKKLPKVSFAQGYGLTETSPTTHFGRRKNGTGDPSAIGWLIPGCEAKLMDPESGKEVIEFNKRGELWLRGPMVMAGYLNNEKATQETITPDGWLKTGDVALVNETQQFYIVDRIKELIKSHAHQVAPAELEAILLSHPDVLDVAVIGVLNSDTTSEMPRAYIVLGKGVSPIKVCDWFNKKVAKHKRLWGGMVVVDTIPKGASGKILRRDLRKRAPGDKPVFGHSFANL